MSVSPASPTLRVHSPDLGPSLSYSSLPVSHAVKSPENLLASRTHSNPAFTSPCKEEGEFLPPCPPLRVTLALAPWSSWQGQTHFPSSPSSLTPLLV